MAIIFNRKNDFLHDWGFIDSDRVAGFVSVDLEGNVSIGFNNNPYSGEDIACELSIEEVLHLARHARDVGEIVKKIANDSTAFWSRNKVRQG